MIVFLTGLVIFRSRRSPFVPVPLSQDVSFVSPSTPKTTDDLPSVPMAPAARVVLPAEVNLNVPFTSQAPKQNWDAMHEEFCEEASMLMVASYISGQAIISPNDADKKLQAIMNFEIDKFGYFADTTAEETATVLREYFKLPKVAVVDDPTVLKIKTALSEGKVVIIPAAGRQLGNPYYTPPGPIYHMLVIKGYQKNGDFIINDSGTKRGANFSYKPAVILEAIHDWNGGNVSVGKKVMIVVG